MAEQQSPSFPSDLNLTPIRDEASSLLCAHQRRKDANRALAQPEARTSFTATAACRNGWTTSNARTRSRRRSERLTTTVTLGTTIPEHGFVHSDGVTAVGPAERCRGLLLDSTVLIDALRGRPAAARVVAARLAGYADVPEPLAGRVRRSGLLQASLRAGRPAYPVPLSRSALPPVSSARPPSAPGTPPTRGCPR